MVSEEDQGHYLDVMMDQLRGSLCYQLFLFCLQAFRVIALRSLLLFQIWPYLEQWYIKLMYLPSQRHVITGNLINILLFHQLLSRPAFSFAILASIFIFNDLLNFILNPYECQGIPWFQHVIKCTLHLMWETHNHDCIHITSLQLNHVLKGKIYFPFSKQELQAMPGNCNESITYAKAVVRTLQQSINTSPIDCYSWLWFCENCNF